MANLGFEIISGIVLRIQLLGFARTLPFFGTYFIGFLGDPGRIRTCNLPLRRELFIFLIFLCFLVLGVFGRDRLYIVCTKPRPDIGLVGLGMGIDAHGQIWV